MRLRPMIAAALVSTTLVLVLGGAAHLAGASRLGDALWILGGIGGAVGSLVLVAGALRDRRVGVDLIAFVAIVGALAVSELFAAAVIAVMLATGRALEDWAAGRAERELTLLAARLPRTARIHRGGSIHAVDVDEVVPGDLVAVGAGDVVPVDGLLESAAATIDESALTGEPLPVDRRAGEPIRSGTVNAGGPLDLRCTTVAASSTYAGIVRLARAAGADTAPFVRLADRVALVFLPVAFGLAAAAWALSGDPVRAVAVLVVATPCPLILAAPVALVSGLSRSAGVGVVVKGGGVLEQLADIRTVVLDKTGTITTGRPAVTGVESVGGLDTDEILRLAASLEQVSPHVLAPALVAAARDRGLALELPGAVDEVAGSGIRGRVGPHAVALGRARWVAPTGGDHWDRAIRRRADLDGALAVFVAVDGEPAGAVLLHDEIRTDAARTIRRLRRAGVVRVALLTGDRQEVGEAVGAAVGADEVFAERSPADKVEVVRAEGSLATTAMVGDGINDAPALALADVGVALAGRGPSASSEAADVVLAGDRIDRLGDAMVIARRSSRIARQSVGVGMGCSLAAMVVAAAGWLPPAAGALTQELIDVAVILNAMRALRPDRRDRAPTPAELAVVDRFETEHRSLRPTVDRLREVADALGTVTPAEARRQLVAVHRFCVEELEPHEWAEDAELYPAVDRIVGGESPTAPMTRAHVEISRRIRRLGALMAELDPAGPDADDVVELRRVLYGLHAVLDLHFAQEEEEYLSLAGSSARRS